MAKDRRMDPNGGREPMDYYEYKRQHELRLMREHAKTGAPLPFFEEETEEEKIPEKKKGGLLSGIKNVARKKEPQADFADEDTAQDVTMPFEQAPQTYPEKPQVPVQETIADLDEPEDVAAEGVQDVPAPQKSEQVKPVRAEKAAPPVVTQEEDEDEPMEDAQERVSIDNPLGDAFRQLRVFGSKAHGALKNLREKRRGDTDEAREEELDEVQDGEPEAQEEQARHEALAGEKAEKPRFFGAKHKQAQKTEEEEPDYPDEEENPDEQDEDEQPRRHFGLFGSPVSAGAGEEDDEDDDEDAPRRPMKLRLPFFGRKASEPEGEEDEDEDESYEQYEMEDTQAEDGEEAVMADTNGELTRKLSKELDTEKPVLSRRERKALAAREQEEAVRTEERPAHQEKEQPSRVEDYPVDEPTQEFKPLRTRRQMVKPLPVREEETEDELEGQEDEPTRRFGRSTREKRPSVYEDDYDWEDDEEEEEKPVSRFARPVKDKKKPARRAADEDDYDEDEDDEPRRGKKAGHKKVYQDEEYDDYDDDDDYDEEEMDDGHVGFGRKLLGFLMGLLVLIVVMVIGVIVLRQLEAGGAISLAGVRNTIGRVIPIESILPAPQAAQPQETMMPLLTPEATQAAQPENSAPAPAQTETPAQTPAQTPASDVAGVPIEPAGEGNQATEAPSGQFLEDSQEQAAE